MGPGKWEECVNSCFRPELHFAVHHSETSTLATLADDLERCVCVSVCMRHCTDQRLCSCEHVFFVRNHPVNVLLCLYACMRIDACVHVSVRLPRHDMSRPLSHAAVGGTRYNLHEHSMHK